MSRRDIRQNLPRTPQTDQSKFPEYVYRAYPRMMKDAAGKPYKNPDGTEVIVENKGEEDLFLGNKEINTAKVIPINPVEALAPAVEPPREKRKYTKRELPADLS